MSEILWKEYRLLFHAARLISTEQGEAIIGEVNEEDIGWCLTAVKPPLRRSLRGTLLCTAQFFKGAERYEDKLYPVKELFLAARVNLVGFPKMIELLFQRSIDGDWRWCRLPLGHRGGDDNVSVALHPARCQPLPYVAALRPKPHRTLSFVTEQAVQFQSATGGFCAHRAIENLFGQRIDDHRDVWDDPVMATPAAAAAIKSAKPPSWLTNKIMKELRVDHRLTKWDEIVGKANPDDKLLVELSRVNNGSFLSLGSNLTGPLHRHHRRTHYGFEPAIPKLHQVCRQHKGRDDRSVQTGLGHRYRDRRGTPQD